MSAKRGRKRTEPNAGVGLADIARVCSLSKMTVSRALRNSDAVSPETRRKVQEAARQMGYVPNRLAVSFSRQESKLVGMVIPEMDLVFFPLAVMSVESSLNTKGYLLSLCSSNHQPGKEYREVRALLERRVDGIIIVPESSTQSVEALSTIQATGCPLVLLDRMVPGVEADTVTTDDFEGAFAAVTHLIEQGYTNIAHIAGSENVWTAEERLRGYKAALTAAGMEVRPDNIVRVRSSNVVQVDRLSTAGKEATEYLLSLSERPDAIFCTADPIAVGAYLALRNHSIEIPKDMGLVGFADILEAERLPVPLTTVAQDIHDLGRQAAKLLLDRMAGKSPDRPVHYVSKTRLVVRQSSIRGSR